MTLLAPQRIAIFLLLAASATSAALATQKSTRAKSPPQASLDINQASAEDFARLSGIGPALARRIVEFREKHGPFRRVEDLLVVRGIGAKKWKVIRPYLRVGEAGNSRQNQEAKGKRTK